MKKLSLTIGWLYPDLMSTYGDRGNIIVLQKRAEWRGIEAKIEEIYLTTSEERLANCDLIFMGGAQDTQQEIVARDLNGKKGKVLIEKIEENTPGLYICGAYQFLGRYYKTADGVEIPGLGIFPLYTENPGVKAERLIGNVVIKPNIESLTQDLIGFENHGGRTHIEKEDLALGMVEKGFGNNGSDKTEGIAYKNSFGTYLHGPILPKNPQLADLLLTLALEEKYKEKFKLKSLDDSIEQKARETVIKFAS
ncbi:MAG TPA: cobalamin biosynthesis protein CobQ [Patescibacteria group bacterium]|nr:cobalamin biosynthesis protein CobQ [Patescibacteria group bacterium]